ncbi:MAG: DUF4386 family protein [Actinomycetota bacterium]
MKTLRKMGGAAGLVASATFVVGLAMFVTMFTDYTTAEEPLRAVEFLIENQAPLYVWNIIIHIVFGIVLVPLVLAVRDQFSDASSALPRVASVFGLIWSGAIIATGMIANISYGVVADIYESSPQTATTVWSTLNAVQNGLGGGNEVLGGVWVLLVSIAALSAQVFPRWINYLGVVMGVAGLATVVPSLQEVGAVFGLGLIVWFVAVGFSLLRTSAPSPLLVDKAEPHLSVR